MVMIDGTKRYHGKIMYATVAATKNIGINHQMKDV
jgi:hypothetical protein